MTEIFFDDIPDTPKTRACLKCSQSFKSAWAGERICGRCKSNEAWRSGHGLTVRAKPGTSHAG